jgi:hypothetical protein
MRRLALLAAVLLLGACRHVEEKVNPLIGPPPQPEVKPFAIPADANFEITESETVASAEDDQPAFVKVWVDGREAGQTAVFPKSKDKKWGAALPPGNHLFRFQMWVLPTPGEWTPLAEGWQPPERFIRVEQGLRTLVTLKLYEGGRRHSLQVAREPLTAPR